MAKSSERCKWVGRSGLCYTYTVMELPCAVHAGQTGNFIFARKDSGGRWIPIYIGHGDLATACSPINNDQWDSILTRRATHIHCHLNESQEAREQEQKDLLARYKNAFEPYGCNPAGPMQVPGQSRSDAIATNPDVNPFPPAKPSKIPPSFPLNAPLPPAITNPVQVHGRILDTGSRRSG